LLFIIFKIIFSFNTLLIIEIIRLVVLENVNFVLLYDGYIG